MLNNGTFPLVFQFIHRRRKLLYYTKYHIFQQQLADGALEVEYCEASLYSMKEIKEINRELKRDYKRFQNRILELERNNEEYLVDDIVEFKKKKNHRSYLLMQYIETQISYKKKMGKDGIAAAYHSTYISLKKYIGMKSARKSDIRMEEINFSFVVGYEDYLNAQGLARNTINYYLRNFRTIYNSSIRDGFKPKSENPFTYIQTKPCKTIKRAINKDDMKKLSSLILPVHSGMDIARDMYLFSFYAQGMAFVDIAYLKWKNISGNRIIYRRHKSKQLIQIVITPQIKSIIDEHGNNTNNAEEYVFSVIKNNANEYTQYRTALGRTNRHLKIISAKLKIDPPLTTYTARHTWATLAREYGAPVSAISAGLGHTKEEMTLVYLKELDLAPLHRINKMVNNLLERK